MFDKLFRRFTKQSPSAAPSPIPVAKPNVLARRTLAKAIEAQDGADISIPKVKALSAALQNHFHDKRQPLVASLIDLLSFSTPGQLTRIEENIASLGSRGVAIESATSTYFRFGAPAVSRYLKLFGITLSGIEASEFLLNLGRAVRFTLSQLPSHIAEVASPANMQEAYPALKTFLSFAAKSQLILSPTVVTQTIAAVDAPTKAAGFRTQLAYELETLINRPEEPGVCPRWRVEEAELRTLARMHGPASVIDPFACLQMLHNEVRSKALKPEIVLPVSFEDRIEIAERAVALVVGRRDAMLSGTLKISSGDRKDAKH